MVYLNLRVCRFLEFIHISPIRIKLILAPWRLALDLKYFYVITNHNVLHYNETNELVKQTSIFCRFVWISSKLIGKSGNMKMDYEQTSCNYFDIRTYTSFYKYFRCIQWLVRAKLKESISGKNCSQIISAATIS